MPTKKKKKAAKKKPAKKKTSKKTAKKKTAKKAKKKTTKKKTSKKKTAKKKTTKKKAAKKKTSKKKTSKKKTTKKTAKKKARKKRRSAPKGVVPWAQRFKKDVPGPWTCPKCGPLLARDNPFYGEDERHHCPNEGCDAVVTLLSKEDLEPQERRGSWPPQRNKNRAAVKKKQ